MRAIIVDDEKHCRDGLAILLSKYCPDVEIVAQSNGGKEAKQLIDSLQPDLLFLDIEMPGMNGFELLEYVGNCPFEIIFTTAYNEYAIQAIRHSALDYLLKPVNRNELVDAVAKVKPDQAPVTSRVEKLLQMLGHQNRSNKIALPTGEGLLFIDPAEILYCESDSAYTRFFLVDKRCITVSKVLKDAEALLTGRGFFRVHHSYVINMAFIQKYLRGDGGEVILTNGKNIPVSRTRRQQFLNQLEQL